MTTISLRFAVLVEHEFATGELVELKSGGLALTVLDFCDNCGDVTVAYTDSDGDIDIVTLPGAALKPYVEAA